MKSLVANRLFAFLLASSWVSGIWLDPRAAIAVDWLTLPSNFTHSPETGARVNQFAQVEAPPLVDQTTRISSGYTHYRSTIQYGQSADNYHRVDQWGPPVRPYGEWQFPYRPYSAPYQEWGAPFAGLNLGLGLGGPGFLRPGVPYGNGMTGNNFPGNPYAYPTPNSGGIPGQPYNPYPPDASGTYPVPPWYDGYHPDLPVRPRLNDREFFNSPSSIAPRPPAPAPGS